MIAAASSDYTALPRRIQRDEIARDTAIRRHLIIQLILFFQRGDGMPRYRARFSHFTAVFHTTIYCWSGATAAEPCFSAYFRPRHENFSRLGNSPDKDTVYRRYYASN